jgi:hypothetical protein
VHHVQHMLGHASLQQTSIYVNATAHRLQAAMRTLDERRAAEENAPRCKPVANEPVVERLSDCSGDDRSAVQVTVN